MSPVFPQEEIEKIGYISEFTLELSEIKDGANRMTFSRFTMTDDIEGRRNPVTFSMSRDSPYVSDDPASLWKGLTYSSVQVAVLAAMKDAYIQRKRVIASGLRPRIPESARDHVELHRLTLSDHVGPYLYWAEPGSVMDSRGQYLTLQTSEVIKEVTSEKERELMGVVP